MRLGRPRRRPATESPSVVDLRTRLEHSERVVAVEQRKARSWHDEARRLADQVGRLARLARAALDDPCLECARESHGCACACHRGHARAREQLRAALRERDQRARPSG